jgi:hypothetical protein
VSDVIEVPEFALEVQNVFHSGGIPPTVTPSFLVEAAKTVAGAAAGETQPAPNHEPPPIAAGLDPPFLQQFKPLSRHKMW